MSLINLLALDDEQMDLVTDSVLDWCEKHRHSVNDEKGRAAMQAAIAIAYSTRCNQDEFNVVLERRLNSSGKNLP